MAKGAYTLRLYVRENSRYLQYALLI